MVNNDSPDWMVQPATKTIIARDHTSCHYIAWVTIIVNKVQASTTMNWVIMIVKSTSF